MSISVIFTRVNFYKTVFRRSSIMTALLLLLQYFNVKISIST